jgi:hypothetical protein
MYFPSFKDGAANCLVVHAFVKEITDEVYDMLRQLHSDHFKGKGKACLQDSEILASLAGYASMVTRSLDTAIL